MSGTPVLDRLVAEGCDRDFLSELLAFYRQFCERERHKDRHKREGDRIKAVRRLASKLEQVQRDIELYSGEPLHALSGRSLAKSLPFVRPQQGLNPTRDSAAAHVRSYAETLKEDISRLIERSGRKDSPGLAIKMIHVYCCNAAHQRISGSKLTDLLCEAANDITDEPITEGAVREHLRRMKGSEDEEWYFAHNLAGAAMRRDKVWDFTRRKLKIKEQRCQQNVVPKIVS